MYVCTRVGQRLALAPRPLMIYCALGEGDCGEIGGIKIGRGN
jgi:hypothetical protein